MHKLRCCVLGCTAEAVQTLRLPGGPERFLFCEEHGVAYAKSVLADSPQPVNAEPTPRAQEKE